MQAQNAQLRLGAVALGLALLLVPVAFGIINPASDAQTLTSGLYLLRQVLFLSSFILLIFGFLALYASLRSSRRERLAFVGMIVTLVGIGLFLPAIGFLSLVSPALAQLTLHGQKDAANVVNTVAITPGAITLLVGSVLLALGVIIFSIAIWGSNTLPRWAGIPFAVGEVILVFHGQLPLVGDILAGLLIAIGGVWLAWGIWRQVSVPAREVSAASMVH